MATRQLPLSCKEAQPLTGHHEYQALWGTIPLYNLALILCKISIAIQYYRVFRNPPVQRIIKVVLVFLVIYGSWAILNTIFTCVPVRKYWDLTVKGGHCINRNSLTFANAGINIISDITLLAIPIVLLRGLQIPRRQKYILVGVFACGSIACVMSIIRLKSLYEIGHAPLERQSSMFPPCPPIRSFPLHTPEPRPLPGLSLNPTEKTSPQLTISPVDGVNIAIWSCIEINVGIICASVPAIKALIVQVFPKLMLSYIYPSHNRNHYGAPRQGTGATATIVDGRLPVRSHRDDEARDDKPGHLASSSYPSPASPLSSIADSDEYNIKSKNQSRSRSLGQTRITVRQSFELNEMSTRPGGDLETGGAEGRSTGEERGSGIDMMDHQRRSRDDGSESDLVAQTGWRADCYAVPMPAPVKRWGDGSASRWSRNRG